MGQNKFALARYHLIDNALRKYDFVKTSFLVEYCKKRTGYNVTQRTIQMDIKAMKNDPFLGFYAPVHYHRQKKAYYYTHQDFELTPFRLNNHEIQLLENLLREREKLLTIEQYRIIEQIICRMKFSE